MKLIKSLLMEASKHRAPADKVLQVVTTALHYKNITITNE
jgi:hypothetical protein